jgi:hypothetical protein
MQFDTVLASPKPAGVAIIAVGDVLTIAAVVSVGGLAGPDASRLRQCIENGFVYEATVLGINGGQVRVRVAVAP